MWVLSHAFASPSTSKFIAQTEFIPTVVVSVGISLLLATTTPPSLPSLSFLLFNVYSTHHLLYSFMSLVFRVLGLVSFRFYLSFPLHNEQIFLNCVKWKKVLLIKLSVAKHCFWFTSTKQTFLPRIHKAFEIVMRSNGNERIS